MEAVVSAMPSTSRCRSCGAPLIHSVVDLGSSPVANSMIRADAADRMEPTFPLHAFVCGTCHLVQLKDYETPEALFAEDYTYFSSYSESWVAHARRYCEAMTTRFGLGAGSKVVEIASNDGYLLQWFVEAGVPVLGVEPATNVAEVANARGVPTTVAFFGRETALRLKAEGHDADLMVANNVLAHVPDINDFVAGFAVLLKPDGVATFEFPHLLNLIEQVQFDTIYHEHFSYLSLAAVQGILARHGLAVVDVETLPTHGGSLRVFVRHAAAKSHRSEAVRAVLAREKAARLGDVETYAAFGERVVDVKYGLIEFFVKARREGKTVVGYGAPAKGNTLLNYCGIGPEMLPYTVDLSPHKQGRLLPGTRIPVHPPARILETRPDYVLILPWNLRDEIAGQMAAVRGWGGRFVVPLPKLEIF